MYIAQGDVEVLAHKKQFATLNLETTHWLFRVTVPSLLPCAYVKMPDSTGQRAVRRRAATLGGREHRPPDQLRWPLRLAAPSPFVRAAPSSALPPAAAAARRAALVPWLYTTSL